MPNMQQERYTIEKYTDKKNGGSETEATSKQRRRRCKLV